MGSNDLRVLLVLKVQDELERFSWFADSDADCHVSVFVQGNYPSMHDVCCRSQGGRLQQQRPRGLAAERARAVRKLNGIIGQVSALIGSPRNFFLLSSSFQLARIDRLMVHLDSFRRPHWAEGAEVGSFLTHGMSNYVFCTTLTQVVFQVAQMAIRVPDGIARGVALFYYAGQRNGSCDIFYHRNPLLQ